MAKLRLYADLLYSHSCDGFGMASEGCDFGTCAWHIAERRRAQSTKNYHSAFIAYIYSSNAFATWNFNMIVENVSSGRVDIDIAPERHVKW